MRGRRRGNRGRDGRERRMEGLFWMQMRGGWTIPRVFTGRALVIKGLRFRRFKFLGFR